MTLFGQWATAHEAFLGFWFGTLLGFAVTYPGTHTHHNPCHHVF
jgi:hypothetical protein